MGKASRRKKEQPTDLLALYNAGTCTKCAIRPRIDHWLWCAKCTGNGRRLRASRPVHRAIPRNELVDMLDQIERELTGQETPDTCTTKPKSSSPA